MDEITISVNNKQVTIPEARKLLNIPEHACFGCYLGDDGPDTHDLCYMGQAYRELQAMEANEPLVTINGERMARSAARRQLQIPDDECMGCLLGEADEAYHDRPAVCLVASGDMTLTEREEA